MKRLFFSGFAIAFAMGSLMMISISPVSAGAIGIDVYPALLPNGYGSPNFNDAAQNAVDAVYNGMSSKGTPGTPSYFEVDPNVNSKEIIATGFPSWHGQADPASVFGSAFANEYGNRMHFAFKAEGKGGIKMRASHLSFSMHSTDAANALGYSFPGGYGYSDQLIGVRYGLDGKFGGGDDTFITSGPATQWSNALVGRGSGNTTAAYCSGCTIAEQQAAIDSVAAYPGYDYDFTGTYSINGYEGSGTFHISDATAVPEPMSASMFGIGLAGFAGLGLVRRRKQV